MILSKNKQNSHGQDTCGKKWYLLFLKKKLFLVVLTCWKRNTFQISMKFHKKKRKFFVKHYFLLHLICFIAHQWFIWTTRHLCFRIYFYIAPRRSQKITMIFFTFVTGVKHTSWCLLRPWSKKEKGLLFTIKIIWIFQPGYCW